MTAAHPRTTFQFKCPPGEYNNYDLALGEHSTFIMILCAPQKAGQNPGVGLHKFGFGKDVPL